MNSIFLGHHKEYPGYAQKNLQVIPSNISGRKINPKMAPCDVITMQSEHEMSLFSWVPCFKAH